MPRDVRLIRSPMSVAGMVLTTVSAVLFLVVFLADLLGLHTNPYIGIVFFLLLPSAFLIGLCLIPLGAWLERRRRLAGKPASAVHWPRIDLNDPLTRLRLVLVLALTMANVVIVSLAAYRGIEYMDSVAFCGQVCHTVMKPEFVSYQHAPHARVACVQCHVDPGAASFFKAKLSGVRRVLAVARGNYPRPIRVAEGLRPARQVCERCHWPEQAHGDVVRRVADYANDEANTESVSTLRLHVGGQRGGIHWHADPANQIEFVATDDKDEVIPYVRLTGRDGRVREYATEGVTADVLAKGRRRRMDCMDCHSRPSHANAATPDRAVDDAMLNGELPKTLPFVRREAIKAVKATYPTEEAAAAGISRALGDFYRLQLPEGRRPNDATDIQQAVDAAVAIYRRNVFPEMSVTFGTYPNQTGHVESPGCFRCHDDSHTSKDGGRIGQDCEGCHSIEN